MRVDVNSMEAGLVNGIARPNSKASYTSLTMSCLHFLIVKRRPSRERRLRTLPQDSHAVEDIFDG